MKFLRIRILNINNINRSLAFLGDRINKLEEQLAGTAAPVAETADESAQTLSAPKPIAETVATPPVVQETPAELSELDKLRAIADEKGIDYDKRSGVKKMTELIEDAENKKG